MDGAGKAMVILLNNGLPAEVGERVVCGLASMGLPSPLCRLEGS